jgi:hypothetical protein
MKVTGSVINVSSKLGKLINNVKSKALADKLK